jgi:molecular chaperone GrpE
MADLGKKTSQQPSEKEARSTKQQKEKKIAQAAEPQPAPEPQVGQEGKIAVDEVVSLREQLRQEQDKSKEHLHKLLYAQADFENYRRRLDQEVESRIDAGKARLIQSLLGIVDELELALKAARNVECASAVAEGIEIVLRKFRDLLAGEGLYRIESIGRKFDPTLHEAVERVPCDEKEEGTVVEEVREGYTLKGKLIRPSIVKIAVPHITESANPKPVEGEKT